MIEICPNSKGPDRSSDHRIRRAGALAAASFAVALAAPAAFAQQKTGPGVPADDSLTWAGITLYGVVDIGLQYDTHSAPFTPYRPSASGNIVRSNSVGSVVGLTPSNMGQSRIGFQGKEALGDSWTAVFQAESFFNPQSGELANAVRSLTANNGVALNKQTVGVDGSSAGQWLQTAFVGLSSTQFGTLTFGRQVTLLSEGTIKYDPNYNASAFGLLGASNSYSGGGSNENNRMDQVAKYVGNFDDHVHVGLLYKFSGAPGTANTAFQAQLGGEYAGLSVDAFYSLVHSSISGSPLSASQVTALPVGTSAANSFAGTVSDNTAYALMALYPIGPAKLFAGYEHIRYTDPATPLSVGFQDIGGYVLGAVNNNAYVDPKILQVYWAGARYRLTPHLDLAAAYYGVHQNAYGTGTQAGCTTVAHSTCSGLLQAVSLDADYRFNVHFDAYLGAMYSTVQDGLASGYLNTNNINPTVGVRFKF